MMNRKGDLSDGIILLVFLFIAAIVFVVYAFIFPLIANGLEASGINTSNETQLAIDSLEETSTTGLNFAFIVLFGGIILVQFISAVLIKQNPVFVVLYFIMMIVAGMLSIYLSIAFDTFQDLPQFADALATQPVITFVWDNILIISVVIDILTMVAIFAKVGQGSPV